MRRKHDAYARTHRKKFTNKMHHAPHSDHADVEYRSLGAETELIVVETLFKEVNVS